MKITDDNDFPEFMKRFEKAKNTKIIFGILGSGLGGQKKKGKDGKSSKLTVVEIGRVHEFGYSGGNIPERSFMRKTFDDKENEIGKVAEEFFGNYIMGDISHDAATKGIGEMVKGMIQKTIREINSPALQPETIRRKKSSQPLVDSGQLLDSIEYKVE